MAEGNSPPIQFPSLYILYPTFNSCLFTIFQGVASTDRKFLKFVHLVYLMLLSIYMSDLSAKSSCSGLYYYVYFFLIM